MTGAYAAVARGGSAAIPYAIKQIVRGDGTVLYTYSANVPVQVISADTAASMTRMMVATIETGTGKAARLDRPAAGKTGTTSSNKDGWFMGFTGDMTAGVWLGRDDNKAVPGLAGGKLPALTWADFMRAATKGLPPQPLLSDPQINPQSEPDAEVYGLDGQTFAPNPEIADHPVPAEDGDVNAPLYETPDAVETKPAPPPAPPKLSRDWLDKTLEGAKN
jgi:penicillin-binding protein 1A